MIKLQKRFKEQFWIYLHSYKFEDVKRCITSKHRLEKKQLPDLERSDLDFIDVFKSVLFSLAEILALYFYDLVLSCTLKQYIVLGI